MSFILRLSANRFPENPQDPDLENKRSPTTIWSRSIRPLLGIVHLAVVGRSPTQLVLEERLWVRTLITRIVNYVVSPSHVFLPLSSYRSSSIKLYDFVYRRL